MNGSKKKDSPKKPSAEAAASSGSSGARSPAVPGGDPRYAELPGPNRVPDDAKGANPGSMVTG